MWLNYPSSSYLDFYIQNDILNQDSGLFHLGSLGRAATTSIDPIVDLLGESRQVLPLYLSTKGKKDYSGSKLVTATYFFSLGYDNM
jgi:hypothetical protein